MWFTCNRKGTRAVGIYTLYSGMLKIVHCNTTGIYYCVLDVVRIIFLLFQTCVLLLYGCILSPGLLERCTHTAEYVATFTGTGGY